MPDRRFRSKYGQVTGPEYSRLRFQEQLEDWLSLEALHYVFTRTPAVSEQGKPIKHSDFEYLVQVAPDAAANQLIDEAAAFFQGLPERDRRRAEYAEQQRKENKAAVAAHVRRKRTSTPAHPLLPGM
jgi:hypothetical protein